MILKKLEYYLIIQNRNKRINHAVENLYNLIYIHNNCNFIN